MGNNIVTYSTFEASVVCAAVANNAPLVQLASKTGLVGSAKKVGLLRLRVQLLTAVISQLQLVVPSGKGTPTGPVDGFRVSIGNGGTSGGGNVSRAYVANAWSVAPTFGANIPTHRDYLPATIGAAFEWTWPESDPYTRELFDSQSTTVGAVVQNVTGGNCGQCLVTYRWMEFIDP